MSLIAEMNVRGESVFKDLSADDEDWLPTEIQSLCMNCYQDGTTRMLLTKIPFFKEIIVSSFSCSNCGWSNTEIQSAGRIQDQGVCYTLRVQSNYIQNVYAPESDPEMTIEKYTRSYEDNEELGLNDMKTEGYQED
uniref:Zinc finger ZPR1-type domain-containing protein n=1 Tax=Gouania willdenowi TaxID=441366 RepID=A0A8C5D0M3_GOUWI